MKKLLSIVILLALVLSLACCAPHRAARRGEVSLYFYAEPKDEATARAEGGIWRGGIDYRSALELRKHVNAIKRWTDDNSCDRELFTFIGEFMFKESERVFFFTEDGVVYYDHYFGRLSDEGTRFLLGSDPNR